MDSWGAALLGAATTVAGLLARGLGMQGGEIQVGLDPHCRAYNSAKHCQGCPCAGWHQEALPR